MSQTTASSGVKLDQRYKFAKLHVLLVDADHRSSQMVKQVLENFGLRRITVARSGREAITALRSSRVNLILMEWNLGDLDGLSLIRTIRNAKNDKFLQFDVPIIMLTGLSDEPHVNAARDAGITEFLAKPFSPKTLSTRLIEVIDRPRVFVETAAYKGPSRRRKQKPPPGMADRRIPPAVREQTAEGALAKITRANFALRDLLDGANASDIITSEVIESAQAEVMKGEQEFVTWVKQDIETLEAAYDAMYAAPGDQAARTAMMNAAYTIKSQSGVFGYDLGTVVADLMVAYLGEHSTLGENQFIVLRKHIDTLGVIFTQRIKQAGSAVGLALVGSLSKLVTKFG